jgi:hypothetical protein
LTINLNVFALTVRPGCILLYGDGDRDIVWQNNGLQQVAFWLMDGVYVQPGGNVFASQGLLGSFQLDSLVDLNADGKVDLVWRQPTTGEIRLWQMNGGTIADSAVITSLGAEWKNWLQRPRYERPPAIDAIGDTLATALNLGELNGRATYSNVLTGLTSQDVYKFTLSAFKTLDLNLFDATGDIDIQLLNSAGTVMQSSSNAGLANERIIAALGPGDYYIRVLAKSGAVSTGSSTFRYTLKVSSPLQLRTRQMADWQQQSNVLHWNNGSNTGVNTWVMNGTTAVDLANHEVSPNWDVIGWGDFDGNRQTDILWRDSLSGAMYVWLMSGKNIADTAVLEWAMPDDWAVEGLGDFDGDGKTDLLWRAPQTTWMSVMLMDGTKVKDYDAILTPVSADDQVAGVADLNADGKADIVWQNLAKSEIRFWLMNGTNYSQNVASAIGVPSTWQVVGLGDLNGDRKADLIAYNPLAGQVGLWLMNGTTVTQTIVDSTIVGGDWRIEGLGDLNGDGRSDIIWRNSNIGATVFWLATANNTFAQAGASVNLASNWVIESLADLNRDGRTDLVWRNTNNSDVALWLMNGTAITSSRTVRFDDIGLPATTARSASALGLQPSTPRNLLQKAIAQASTTPVFTSIEEKFSITGGLEGPENLFDKYIYGRGGATKVYKANREIQLQIVGTSYSANQSLKQKWQPKNTWIVMHGWNGSALLFKNELALTIAQAKPDDIVLVLDWSNASGGRDINGNFRGSLRDPSTIDGGQIIAATWTRAVAKGLHQHLVKWGLTDGNFLNLVGQSNGTLLAAELADLFSRSGNKVKTLTVLEPPSEANSFNTGYAGLDFRKALDRDNLLRFDQVSSFSRAFNGASSIPGNEVLARTAHESILVNFENAPTLSNPGWEHAAVWEVFRNFFKTGSPQFEVGRKLFGLDDYDNQNRTNVFRQNFYRPSETNINEGFEGELFVLGDLNGRNHKIQGFRTLTKNTQQAERIIYGTEIDDVIVSARGYRSFIYDPQTGISTPPPDDAVITDASINDRFIDRLQQVKRDFIYAGNGNDQISATRGDDLLFGDGGDDKLTGNAGNDRLNGGDGDDTLIGVDPDSSKPGLRERDTLTGGEGKDTFILGDRHQYYYAGDGENDYAVIEDFKLGTDRIQLKGDKSFYEMTTIAEGTKIYRSRAPLDIFFVQDISSSFQDDLSTLNAGLIDEVVRSVKSIQANTRFGLASFADFPNSTGSLDRPYVLEQSLSDNANQELQSAYTSLSVTPGGDFKESQLYALAELATQQRNNFRSGSIRIAILFTDAAYHEDTPNFSEDDKYPTVSRVASELRLSGILPIFAVKSNETATYSQLVQQLGMGQVVTLARSSSNIVAAVEQSLQQAGAGKELVAIIKGQSVSSSELANASSFVYV